MPPGFGCREGAPHSACIQMLCFDQNLERPMPRACSSPSRILSLTTKSAVQMRGGVFFALRMRKNTTAQLVAWTGYVWPVSITQAMGGRITCCCPDPVPPVAVVTDQPAKHVLSRSAEEKSQATASFVTVSGSSSIFRMESGLRYIRSYAQSSAYSRM